MMEKYSDLMHYPQSYYLNWPSSTSATKPTGLKLLFFTRIIALFKEVWFY